MEKKFKPLPGKALIEVDDTEEVTVGGLLLPRLASLDETPSVIEATVVAIGDGAVYDRKSVRMTETRLPEPVCREGDRVLVKANVGVAAFGEEKLRICLQDEILAVVEK